MASKRDKKDNAGMDIAKAIIDRYDPKNAEDMQDAIKDIFGPMFEAMLQGEMETKDCAVYVILGYDVNGVKDILGIWISETEGEHYWMQVFDGIRARGVEDVLSISMDGVSGLEEGARSISKDVVVQRCIVHLVYCTIHV